MIWLGLAAIVIGACWVISWLAVEVLHAVDELETQNKENQ